MNKTRTITDIKGVIHTVNLEDTIITEFKNKRPHWGWWVFWLIVSSSFLFYPALLIMLFIKKRVAVVNVNGVEILVTEALGHSLMNDIDKVKNN